MNIWEEKKPQNNFFASSILLKYDIRYILNGDYLLQYIFIYRLPIIIKLEL